MKSNKFLVLLVVFVLVFCISALGSVSAAENNSSNNTAVYSNTTGQSQYTGPQTNTTKWTNSSLKPRGQVAITKNGTIYIQGASALQAFNPDGTLLWSFDAGSSTATPIVGSDGTIYALTSTSLYAINPNGTEKWHYGIGSGGQGDIVLDSNGIIYFAAGSIVYAIDTTLPDPSLVDPKWVYPGPSTISTGVALSPDDKTLYFITYNPSTLYALNKVDGSLKWSYATGAKYAGVPVVDSNGIIYFGVGYNGMIYAIIDSGDQATVKWNTTVKDINRCNVVIGSNGIIYIASTVYTADNFYAINSSDGSILHTATIVRAVQQSKPVIGSDGTVYIGTGNGNVYAFNPDLTLKWKYAPTVNAQFYMPTIGPDGTLYIGSSTLGFFAFQDLVANFISSAGSGLDVSFVDASSNIPKYWIWDFGDGSDLVYDVQNPTHTYGAPGTYTVKLTVITEPGDSDTVEKVITVNQAPTLDPIGDRTVDENESLTFTVVGHDSVGDNLTYSVTGLPAGATFNSATGAFNWTPNFNQAGTYHITFTVSDGSLTASETITITVNDVDNVAPTVVTVDPANNKVINGVNKAIVITFSENIKAGSAFSNIKVTNPDGVSVNPLYKVISGRTLTLTRIGNYINGLMYTVTLPTGSITDMVGNVLSTFTSKFTVDNAKPIVSSVNPANNKVISGVNRAIVITFSENIKAGSAFTSIKVTNPDGVAVNPLYKVINGRTLTLTRIGNYINGLTYTITLPTGSITDTVGNALTTFTSKFKVDNAKPTVTSVNPANNKVISGVNRAIVITFSENIKAGSAFSNIKVTNPDGVAVKPLYKVINGKTLTLTRNGNYINGLTYTITLPTGSITDTAGNALSTFTSKFKVDNTKPTVTSVNPANNKVINMANKAIVITFSENIKAGSAFTSIKVTNPDGVAVKPLYKVINGKTLTLTRIGNYINGLTYTITLPTGSITDAAGNAITTYTSKFTTRRT